MRTIQPKLILISLIIVCLLAPIKFYAFTVPLTLQTWALFSVAMIFGKKTGFIVALLYIILGALGLPVLAGFNGGIEKMYGPTAGFIWAFPFVNYYLGWESERREPDFFHHIVAFVRGHFLLLIPGFLVLYFSMEGVKLWDTFILLLPGLFLKSIVGGLITSFAKKKASTAMGGSS